MELLRGAWHVPGLDRSASGYAKRLTEQRDVSDDRARLRERRIQSHPERARHGAPHFRNHELWWIPRADAPPTALTSDMVVPPRPAQPTRALTDMCILTIVNILLS